MCLASFHLWGQGWVVDLNCMGVLVFFENLEVTMCLQMFLRSVLLCCYFVFLVFFVLVWEG